MDKTHTNPALTGRIIPTFLYYVIPSSISLIAITTANLVDGIFVGNHIGADALAAITLLVPYLTVLFAIALMFAIGGSVSAGTYLGEAKFHSASRIFNQSLIAIGIISTTLAVLSVFFEQQLYQILNAPLSVQPVISQYFSIIRWVLIIQLFSLVLYYFIRIDGHPLLATCALVSGALMNILLDALFIVHLNMGLAGAAYATLLAQIVQCLILMSYFFSAKRTLRLSLRQSQWSELRHAAFNGLSEFINEISVGLIFLLINYLVIARLGLAGIAAFSVVNYFIFLSIMLCYGIADALHLVISQNYGAKHTHRIEQFLLTGLCCALALGGVLLLVLLQWQHIAISWFLDSKAVEVADLAAQILLLIWPLFLVNGLNIILSCYLTAIHKPRPSALIATARSLVLPGLLLVLLYTLLPQFKAILWATSQWSFLIALPLAEWCTFILAIIVTYPHWPSSIKNQH